MIGRLKIEFGSLSGDATGERLNHDIAIDIQSHGISTDSNGYIHILFTGRILTKEQTDAPKKRSHPHR